MSYNFACIGVAGYIAPRHLRAIKTLKHNLILSYDKNDTVGILDKYFPKSLFFNKYSLFKKNFLAQKKIDYTIIVTPNNTHYKYIKFALSHGSNVICEKPLVIFSKHLDQIEKLEKKYQKNVFTILQLRTLRVIKKIKREIKRSKKHYKVKINYITPRGQWYQSSWKSNVTKSGGILFNIGIHLLDLLYYLFGDYIDCKLIKENKYCSKGTVNFNKAKATFYLSINQNDLKKYKGKKVVRDFIINNKKIDLVKNFDQAHIETYRQILQKKYFSLNTVKKSILLAENLKK
jgi:UDP-N-acetyl-2-amino-2-deoxyglucuronate dehydrogenase